MSNLGIENEYDILNYLHGKRYKELNRKWKKHIKVMFPKIKRNDLIYSGHFKDKWAKPDIYVKVNNRIKYISIKTGRNASVHDEKIKPFYDFLKKLNISDRTLKIMLFYHYGYSEKLSNNGVPFTREEILENYKNYIDEANAELNKKYILREIIKRCVLKGTERRDGDIDFMYYGVLKDGYLMSEDDIYDLIMDDNSDEGRGIHFGGLIYQAGARSRFSNRVDEVKIKWPLLNHKFYDHKMKKVADSNYRSH